MPARTVPVAVYGTLRRGERNHPTLGGATFLGTGIVRGRLHVMPQSALRAYAYPALVLDGADPDSGADPVVVEIYGLPDPATLAALDELEGHDPADAAGSEYVRTEVEIEAGPVARAWVYLFNGPPTDVGERIAGGDWVAFMGAPRG